MYSNLFICMCIGWILETSGVVFAGSSIFLEGPNYLGLSVAQVVKKNGFGAHTYDVQSRDGYITTITRVINPKVNISSLHKTVVIHHGNGQTIISPQLSLCGDMRPVHPSKYKIDDIKRKRINRNETICLPYHLSNSNYDVWLLEGRGTTPRSSRHINKTISHNKYWDFVIEDCALNDIPAQIAKVKEITGRSRVAYISYSISTAYMLILLSEQPEFSQNLTAFIAVAPISFSHNSYLRILGRFVEKMPGYIKNSLRKPLPKNNDNGLLNIVITKVCKHKIMARTICRNVINFLLGPDEGLNLMNLPFFSRILAHTTLKGFIEAIQWTKEDTFNRYDYNDPNLNIQHYGQTHPPKFNISNINMDRMVFVRSPKNDYISTNADTLWLKSRLKVPLFRDILVPASYNHFSYWMASTSFLEVIHPISNVLEEIYSSLD